MRRLRGWIIAAIFLAPVLGGFAGVVLPAAGHMPQIGAYGPDLSAVRALLDWPGLARSVALSLQTGLAASFISLVIASLITARWIETRGLALLQSMLAPFLAIPHAAAAFGVAFLIAPSGWVARLLSPWATGWARPPDVIILNDPQGLALIAGLTFKEAPFLILMMIGALSQVKVEQTKQIASTLGYGSFAAWAKLIFPQLYRQIRLPMFIVISYSASSIDTALILGPQTPPPLAVQLLRWMNDPDLAKRMMAAAGAVVQILIVLLCFGLWRVGEVFCAKTLRLLIWQGGRGTGGALWSAVAVMLSVVLVGGAVLGAIPMVVWSFAKFWSFPDALPNGFTGKTWWGQSEAIYVAAGDSLLIAGISITLALGAVILVLQTKVYDKPPLWIYAPLLVPQISFLPGMQVLLLAQGWGQGVIPVIIGHLVFVVPYVFLTLLGPWNALDPRFDSISLSLGRSPFWTLFKVRLPLLLRPIMIALALGTAVSIGQFLPTLLLGGGRVITITTETIALASGGDRRVLAVWSLMQMAGALAPFILAAIVPRLIYRDRKGMING